MKKNFIILIGSDGAGKSTVAQELQKVLGYPVEHHGSVKSYEDGKHEYFSNIEKINYSVIKDRFHEGEQVYAPIYRGYTADYFPELEKALLHKFSPLLVQIQPPFEVILKRIEERGEDFVKPEHFRYAYDKIDEIYENSNLPKMKIDSDYFSASVIAEIIVYKMFGLQL